MVQNGLLNPEDADAGDSLICESVAKDSHTTLDAKSAIETSSEGTLIVKQVVKKRAARRSASMLVWLWELLIDTLHSQSS